MAAAATLSTSMFEISYQGSRTYNTTHGRDENWDIDGIDLRLYGMASVYFAQFDNTDEAMDTTVKFLKFSKSSDPLTESVRFLEIPTTIARTMDLRTRIFKQVTRSEATQTQHDDTVMCPLPYRRDDLPIEINERPEFEPGASYQLKVTNENNTLKARFEKVDPKASEAQGTWVSDKTTATDPMEEHSSEYVLNLIMDRACQYPEADPELDALNVTELRSRYDRAYAKSSQLQKRLAHLCSIGFVSEWSKVKAVDVENTDMVERLVQALHRQCDDTPSSLDI